MIDAYQARSLYEKLEGRGFEPNADAQRLYSAMVTTRTPDVVLAEAKAALKAATIAGNEKAAAAAQKAVTEASNVRSAWDSFEELRRDYAVQLVRTIASDGFRFIADLYDTTGKAFGEAVASGAVDADPGRLMVTGSKQQREAWAAVPGLVAELEALSGLLGAIIRATGRRYHDAQDPKYAGWPLGLLVAVNGAHVRRLVECWCWRGYTPQRVNPQPPSPVDQACMGRGGRWAGLVTYGALLQVPCATLAEYRPLTIAPHLRGGADPYDSTALWAKHVAREEAEAKREAAQRASIRRAGGKAEDVVV